ncbi:MAG: hypothetical protein B7Z62_04805 [Deltaproteobacteria bacterium 37-65-8]|nr:MAG: hypothetical protein B7Z62_04805 [Deltaproteobacteria bacterium 37-65-8]HQT97270.1 glycosyltransferase [Thermodesulfobacteriota bacterium]
MSGSPLNAAHPVPEAVCALVVTYRCGAGVGPSLSSLLPQVGKILVIDNGSGEETLAFLEGVRLRWPDHFVIHSLPENIGIAGALNLGMRKAMAMGFGWVLTMDHDSEAAPDLVARLIEAISHCPDPGKVLVSAPVSIDQETGEPGVLPAYSGWRKRVLSSRAGSAELLYPDVVIASGNLVDLRLCGEAPFDETLFIDYVDHDFCLKGKDRGLSIVCVPRAVLRHRVGNRISRNLLGRRISCTNHPAGRRYYQARNLVEMVRRYGRRRPGYALDIVKSFLRDILGIFLLEEGRGEKIRAIARGVLDSGRHFRRT